MNTRKLAIIASVVGLCIALYLLWEYGILATVGSYAWRLLLQFWELAVRFLLQFWEISVRLLEFLWRPLLLFAENIVRGLATRPFGRLVAWFFAGITLRYLLGPRARALYERVAAIMREKSAFVLERWYRLSIWTRIVIIVVGALCVASVNVGLLLLPLGFLIEPIFRYLRTWLARESLERVSFAKRFNRWVYWRTRWLMRESPLFRKCLWPLRYRRLMNIRHARRLHFQYRKQGTGLSHMLKDLVKRDKKE